MQNKVIFFPWNVGEDFGLHLWATGVVWSSARALPVCPPCFRVIVLLFLTFFPSLYANSIRDVSASQTRSVAQRHSFIQKVSFLWCGLTSIKTTDAFTCGWMESVQNIALEETTGMSFTKWRKSGLIRSENPSWLDSLKDEKFKARQLCWYLISAMECTASIWHCEGAEDAQFHQTPGTYDVPEVTNDPTLSSGHMYTHNVQVDIGWQRR